jgi:hypothetical protein
MAGIDDTRQNVSLFYLRVYPALKNTGKLGTIKIKDSQPTLPARPGRSLEENLLN